MSKIIQSGRFLGALLGKLVDQLIKVLCLWQKVFLASLAIMESASATDGGIQRKTCGRGTIVTSEVGVTRAGEGTTLVIFNYDMDDIIKIIKFSCID